MKTMKRGDKIVRVNDKEQFDFLRRGYAYISKSEWKKSRVSNKPKQKETK